MTHDERRQSLLRAALAVAREKGYHTLNRATVAEEAECSPGLVQYHFHTTDLLRLEVAREAQVRRDIPVLAQIVTSPGKDALLVPKEFEEELLRYLSNLFAWRAPQ